MSFHHTRSSNRSKSLSIPEHVPIGVIIGKGGSNCKAIRANHGVFCKVDVADRKVTLTGPMTGIKSAEDELANLFSSIVITKPGEERVFDIVVRDGPTRWWSFEKDKESTSDKQIQEYPYRLQQSGRAVETPSLSKSWIKEFRQEDTTRVMSYLLDKPSELPPKIKVAFGKLCFKLKSIRCENSTIAWPELQNLRNFNDFTTRWSNFCRRSSPSIVALMDDLEEWMEKGVEPQKSLSVHLAGYEGKSYDLKYHLVDGQWELHNAYSKRYVRGTYDVILDNDTSFRVRAVTREKISKNVSADIQRCLAISIPDDDIFHTKVALTQTAQSGMYIKSFDAKLKVHVETNEEKTKLSTKDNEAHVLLEKVLQYNVLILAAQAFQLDNVSLMLGKTVVSIAAAAAISSLCVGAELSVVESPRVQDLNQTLQRVAFGSCNDQSFPQPMWSNIAAHNPELWIWMGDNIYADVKELGEPRPVPIPPRKMFVEATREELIRRYNKLLANDDYAAFVNRTPIIGIWDDHDYGINDGGKYYSYREDSQQVFLDFINEPKDSPRRKQEGIYTSYTVGTGDRTIKFILVDNRYHRDDYGTNDGNLLGEAQWKWLENELMTSSAAFNVIVSGIQILPGDRYPVAECWGRFPSQRERLLKLILASHAKGVILLSGDVHFSEINQVVCSNGTNTITEITSSGMTHSWMEFHVPSMKYIMALLFTYANLVMPWEFRPTQKSFYGHLNWGSIDFDWENKPYPVAVVKTRGADDQVKLQYEFESKPYDSDSPEQDAAECRAPRLIPRWQRLFWHGLFVGVVGVFLLLIPVNALVLLWLVWYFIKKALPGKKSIHKKTE
ncbi:hypothetical protein PHPALM_30546 [Phytophthora palmivora]|uniref:K Homology domain-containing protein n=1 Tax=Phytophthora palmivora TaxID=4796 RepID=A0A2P4X4U8_9STRA|nr:hypothetical protein PHPALM_30546 [Phytophthora palmivora]